MRRRALVSVLVLSATAIVVACGSNGDTSHPPMIGDCASINCTQPPGTTTLPPQAADATSEAAADADADADDATSEGAEGGVADETG